MVICASKVILVVVILASCWMSQIESSSQKNRQRGHSRRLPLEESSTNTVAKLLVDFERTSSRVFHVLRKVALHSWEWGTESQVILERQYPCLGVYSKSNTLPIERSDQQLEARNIVRFIDPILKSQQPGKLPLVDGDGSSADPASLGVAVMVAAATVKDEKKSEYYLRRVRDQLTFLTEQVPRSKTGAISHREGEVGLWADFIYMVTPFLAFYGAQTSDIKLLEMAYTQVKLYRQALTDPEGKTRLWRHIVPDVDSQANITDPRYWATGNGWAVTGMMRVYATMKNLKDDKLRVQTQDWRSDLADWTAEIVIDAFKYQDKETGLLPNAFLEDKTFFECSGTAAIAAGAYRLLSFEPKRESSLPMSAINQAVTLLFTNHTNGKTGAVAPVVNPLNWSDDVPFNGTKTEPGYVSPEGQAFILMLQESIRSYMQTTDPTNKEKYTSKFVLQPHCT